MAITTGQQRGSSIDLKTCVVFLKTRELASNGGGLAWFALKFGEGNFQYTRNKNTEYMMDRGRLDDVRRGDDAPLDVSFDGKFTYSLSRSDANPEETYSLEEIVEGVEEGNIDQHGLAKFAGTRESWLASYGCPPYCCDIEIHQNPGLECTDTEVAGEAKLFRYFRANSVGVDYSNGMINVSGQCHILRPMSARVVPAGVTVPADPGSGVFPYSVMTAAKPMDYQTTFWAIDPRDPLHPLAS